MLKSIVKDFLDNFDESRYPEDFLNSYEAIECLGYNEQGETLLVKDRNTGTYYIAKCYEQKMLLSQTVESDLLKNLKCIGLPVYIGEYQNETMHCFIREYIEGNTLDLVIQERRFTLNQIISIGIKLCNILSYLHNHKPPIIHRDIKPQNIIFDNDEKVYLIDFGISRLYKEETKNDTKYFGTLGFAPPEQFGFSQTDCRADIFSLGVVLCWLFTGDTDTKMAISRIEDKNLRHIVKTCTAFAPEKRFKSTQKMKLALLSARRKTGKKIARGFYFILICSIFLCIGFIIGRFSKITPFFIEETSIQFEEPLIEKAVCLALNKKEGSEIREEELLEVTELYIYGNKAVVSAEEFDALGEQLTENNENIYNGGISSLHDVTKLKNLRTLNIALQNITDLTPLEELDKLEQIDLKHNPIRAISALKSMPALSRLYLYDTIVSDLSSLRDCPRLENLVIGKTYVTSIKAVTGIKNLTYLHAAGITLDTLSGIEEFEYLQEISFYSIADSDLSPLLSLSHLKKVYLSKSMKKEVEKIDESANFDIIYQE